MDTSSFKISSSPVTGIGINVKDVSPWTGTERKDFGFALFLTVSGVVTRVLEDYFFDEWTVELFSSETIKVEVFGVPIWDRTVEYTIGEIVLAENTTGYTFYKALGTSTGSIPLTQTDDWLKMSTETAAENLVDFAAEKTAQPTVYYYDISYETIDESKITYSKTSCYNYAFDIGGTGATHYSIHTLEQFNNGTSPIVAYKAVTDPLNIVISDLLDENNLAYSDGIYVVTFVKGSNDIYVLIERVVLVEVCKIVACYKKIVMEVLCKVCGCDSGCTDEEIALDRKMRDFLNMYLASFSLVLAYLNKDYVDSINAVTKDLSPEGELFAASTIIARLVEIIDNCNMCSDE